MLFRSTGSKLSNMLRSDIKFDIDSNNKYVFSLYTEFETLSDDNIVGDEIGRASCRERV